MNLVCDSMLCFIFFFKQKTAYEMHISDWSSDVCSSDLRPTRHDTTRRQAAGHPGRGRIAVPRTGIRARQRQCDRPAIGRLARDGVRFVRQQARPALCRGRSGTRRRIEGRSEEHTSELQSLMRISYAVFCLKKKKKKI